jgi:hypothetical protein
MKRTTLALMALAFLVGCAAPGVLEASETETRTIDGVEMLRRDNLPGEGEGVVAWVGGYTFQLDCNTCTGVVTCYEKVSFYECSQSGYVTCTLLACSSATPVFFVPKEEK